MMKDGIKEGMNEFLKGTNDLMNERINEGNKCINEWK